MLGCLIIQSGADSENLHIFPLQRISKVHPDLALNKLFITSDGVQHEYTTQSIADLRRLLSIISDAITDGHGKISYRMTAPGTWNILKNNNII